MRLMAKIKIFIWILCAIGMGCFFVLPVFAPIRAEIVRLGKKVAHSSEQAKDTFIQKTGWRLNEVDVMGATYTKRSEWVAALNLQKNQSMHEVDLNEIHQNLMRLPWVKSVVVARYLPDTLKIYITEKTPVALWQNKGQYRPLDEFGKVIEDPAFSSNEILLVVGPDAPEHTLDLLRALDQVPDVAQHIQSAVRVEGRRWNLYTSDKVKILLPQTEMEKALQRLAHKNSQENLLKKEVASIDMRTNGKIRLTLHPKKAPQKKKAKK